ncbi:unnamed protein product [Gongylonema pulchrum]|uniref:Transposase n=1 Tax=Gongylonema pulchrum TaxID=637853 RepID=A0A183E692_9BILA|nr:unnamed protein product [Gongylonema pulchrum]
MKRTGRKWRALRKKANIRAVWAHARNHQQAQRLLSTTLSRKEEAQADIFETVPGSLRMQQEKNDAVGLKHPHLRHIYRDIS